MTLQELDSFLKERGIEVVGSIDSTTFIKEVLGIGESSIENRRRVEYSQNKIPEVMAFATDGITKAVGDIDYSKTVKGVLGIPDDSDTSKLTILKKEFLQKIEKASEELQKNVDDIKIKSEELSNKIKESEITKIQDPSTEFTASAPVDTKLNQDTKQPESFYNSDVSTSLESKITPDTKKSINISDDKQSPNNSFLEFLKANYKSSEITDKLDNLVKISNYSAEVSQPKTKEDSRLQTEKTQTILESILQTNKDILTTLKKPQKNNLSNDVKKLPNIEGGGILGFIGSILGIGLLTKLKSFKNMLGGLGTRFGGLAARLTKITAIVSLGTVALEALYPAFASIFNWISSKLGFKTQLEVPKIGESNVITKTAGLDKPGVRDTFFRTGLGAVALLNLKNMIKDPNRTKTLRDLGRRLNVKQGMLPFSGGAGRARQAAGEITSKAYSVSKDVAKSAISKIGGMFNKQPVLTEAQKAAKVTAENIQRIKAATDAKLASQAAKLVPSLSKAAQGASAIKETSLITKALSGLKSFGTGVAGRIGKMAFGTVATGILGGFLKKIPLISGIYELYMAYKRYTEGDYKGMVLRLLSASSNLLLLLGPQMAFLQMPLSWWLDSMDEADQPTTQEPSSTETGSSTTSKSTSTSVAKPTATINKKDEKKLNANIPEDIGIAQQSSSLSIQENQGDMTDSGFIDVEKPPQKWQKIEPTTPPPPLPPTVVNPPPTQATPIEQPVQNINAPTTNIINNNSSVNMSEDPNMHFRRRRITAKDYRHDW